MKENIKRLYAHYSKIGYTKAKEDLEAKYPYLKEPEVKREEEVKEDNEKPKRRKRTE